MPALLIEPSPSVRIAARMCSGSVGEMELLLEALLAEAKGERNRRRKLFDTLAGGIEEGMH